MHYSFDIFDTIITRTVAEPHGIFLLMQKVLKKDRSSLPDQLLDNFCDIRIKAERSIRSLKREWTIVTIYSEIQNQYLLTESDKNRLIALEEYIELNNILPIKQNIEYIRQVRKENGYVIFISDIYLSIRLIKNILNKYNILESNDKLFVSSEHNKTKESGELFDCLIETMNISPDKLQHLGDNYLSDYIIPQKKGIVVPVLYRTPTLNRYEKFLVEDNHFLSIESQIQLQFLAGASKNSRLNSTSLSDIFKLGVSIAAPVFYSYVYWIKTDLDKREKIGNINFLARDGQLLYKIFKIMNGNIQSQYIYASRQVLSLAQFNEINSDFFDYFFRKDPIITIQIIANRLNLNVDLFNPLEIAKNKNLNKKELDKIRKYLSKKENKKLLFKKIQDQKQIILKYFLQSNAIANGKMVIVDSGWNGNLQNAIYNILREFDQTVIGYYYGLFKNNSTLSDFRISYLQHEEYCKKNINNNLIEILLTADHGTAVNYEYTNKNSIRVKLGKVFQENSDFACQIQQAAIIFTKEMNKINFPLNLSTLDHIQIALKTSGLIKILDRHPLKEESEILGRLKFTSDQSETTINEFAPEIKLSNLLGLKSLFTKWDRGSYKRSSNLIKVVVLINKQILKAKVLFRIFIRNKPGIQKVGRNQSKY